ncbi:hypothetical protein A3C91_04645 [Candidatus Azambacteria bacterium RIFCSPHIGHO2_02_FULL_52_12]|uniref:8-oxo-dGTP diphosphatase n=1 Tax=Candidatus Azambacteria bacterium RIFCSPLOWO2_01_FULL_46_25 TaxID=1797298 RepID=A0A1F5BV53_9BACT|nr:MAG: hypothetical protein A3C91_04645 [Candidatus Azambacteria bacterium RIFCSPHIGHO2_02_FULL_52_12]OGD34489.1 MAG: hypothetical protein A2988_03140 [Candidatus Azambacteria bacterium RIFCSPLOWO2_01_FULL_46_25]OGD38026.1 MAG: hypothetical protein A2850_02960 [Candidatus Azambacteria bacterium RIFCSPHIGHO2_01_FULL_51_74]
MREIQKFQVGIKAFMVNEKDKLLLMQESRGVWEIPGGRIDVGEELLPHADILKREIAEELGEGVRYEISRPVTTWVRQNPSGFVFLIGFLCIKKSGDIVLSPEHKACRWVDAQSWQQMPLAPGYHNAIGQFWKAYKQ